MELAFVDANVIIDAVADENSPSFEYFARFRGKSRAIITSTHAIGEAVNFLYRSAKSKDDMAIDRAVEAFKKLFDLTNIEIKNVTARTLELINSVMEEDSRIMFKDAIHVAVASENRCVKFATLDTGIGRVTLKKFGLKLENPSESDIPHFP